jgi:integrase
LGDDEGFHGTKSGHRAQKENARRGQISNPLLEPEEDKKLLEALPNCLRLMTILALQTAARRGEIVSLKWEAVHPENIEL